MDDSLLKFSLRLYKQVLCQNNQIDNVVCSPIIIASAISMLLAGARSKTAKELYGLLNVKASVDKLRDYFSALLADLTTYAPEASFCVASRIYSEKQLPVQAGYISLLQNFFGTTLKCVDFRKSHEAARQEANAWISQETTSKIRELLPPGIVDADTASILLNAVYVQGFWQSPFQWRNTRPQEFHVDSGNSVVVDMLYQERTYRLGHSDALRARALEIPCRGLKVSMVVVLPDAPDGLGLLQERLTLTRLCALLSSLNMVMNVELSLPKFKLDSSILLKDSLSALGAKEVFAPGCADLSGIFETERPAVANVVHKTFVQVDEGGMDAACWSALTRPACCATIPLYTTRFVVDHPFMFLIKGNDPDVIICLGSVRRP
ncbi:leukocyte elastase inhibitor B [Dermacentor silvarum]|uniref:leukocyte elastase inhibitor B n=1 Tax=Dermacentor silvarum TaxID=543639 RepID=UPI001898FD62|nr:leukocyte elastase inhibitor B [Dermacentor silvarum]